MEKLNCKSLMIGDWVIYRGEPTIVYEIDDYYKRINTEPDGYDSIRCIEISEIEPIPLTSEILEKNGFKYMTGLWYFRTKEIIPIQIVFKETNVITLSIKCTPVPINLKHVHQLQHALSLYGIEKEIIL